MKDLLSFLEDFLANEGLGSQIPKFRKKVVFSSPPISIVIIWFGGLWLSLIGLHYFYLGLDRLWLSALMPLGVFIALLLGLAFYYAVKQSLYEEKIEEGNLANSIGGLYLISFPVIICVLGGLILGSWKLAIIYFGSSLVLLLLVLFINSTYFLKLTFHLFRASLSILAKSLSTLIGVFPVLLAVIFLSIFSKDFWLVLTSLPWSAILLIVLLLFSPAVLLSYVRTGDIVEEIIGQFPRGNILVKLFRGIEFFEQRFDKDQISRAKWQKVLSDLEWRDFDKLESEYGIGVIKATTVRTAIYIELTSFLLLGLFFSYFIILFGILFPGQTLVVWIAPAGNLLGTTTEIFLKVALVLGAVMSITARVSTFTDGDYKSQMLGWIGDKARDWFSALVIYDTVISPNFQFWKYKVNDGRIFNVYIIVNSELNENEVEGACRSMANRAPDTSQLIIVTAFEKEEKRKDYDFGHQGNRWQLLINRSKAIEEFRNMTLDLGGDLRFDNEMGLVAEQNGELIPNEWFGNTTKSQEAGKVVWASDPSRELFEHPYVFEAGGIYNLEVSLSKRLSFSKEYKLLAKTLFNLLVANLDVYKGITVSINFRGTGDYLMDLYYIPETKSLSYRDAFMRSTKYYKPSGWID